MSSTSNINPSAQPANPSMNSSEPMPKPEPLATSSHVELLPDPERDVAVPGPSQAPGRCSIRRYWRHPPPRPTSKPEVLEVNARSEQALAGTDPRPEVVNPSSSSEPLPLPVGQVDPAPGSRDVSYYVHRGILSVSRRLGNRPHLDQVDRERPERTDQGSPEVTAEVLPVFLTD